MSLNLVSSYRTYSDTGPYISLSEADLGLLRDGDLGVSGIAIAEGETMAVIVDLVARYRLETLYYYRESSTIENITVFGKQGATPDYDWEEIPVTVEASRIVCDLSSLADKYQFIRLVHTAVSGAATAYELEVYADVSVALFGSEGQFTKLSVDSGTSTLFVEEIPIFNPDSVSHTYYVLPEGEDPDSVELSISSTSSGIFQALHESGVCLPDDYVWSAGYFSNTQESGDEVTLISGSSGYYYTPVLDISSLEGRRLFWKFTTSGTSELDESGSVDSVPTVGIRLSNTMPEDIGWSSGTLSVDPLWSVVSGTLSFEPYSNYSILNPKYVNYFQARVEFSGDSNFPVLEKIGVEEGLPVFVSAGQSAPFYAKSNFQQHVLGRQTSLIVWYLEARNEEQ